jgi:Do/DeqQ family serine protease
MRTNIGTIAIAFASGMLGAISIYYFLPSKEHTIIRETNSPVVRQVVLSGSGVTGTDFVAASAASTQSVVFIKTLSTSMVQMSWFDFLLGGGQGVQQQISSGSGVIYTKDGYIITNNHVIEKAEKIEVVYNKRTYEARLVGTDPSTDLAVLKIKLDNLPVIKLGSSKELNVGDWVLAVGNPFNLESTVTAGIVSAKSRMINIVNSRFPIESFIQTDAAINPGNSGGALVNVKGELVGINTAILSRTGSYAGYGFAVPIDIVKKAANDIIQFGEVQKSFLGVEVNDLDENNAKKLGINDLNGVVITSLNRDGGAEKAGLKVNDVIIRINSESINGKANYDETISYFHPGQKVKVLYTREGKLNEVEVILTNREGTTTNLKRVVFSSNSVGADLEAVSKVERDKLGIDSGVKVLKLKGGLFSQLGVPEGFIVSAVNKKKVNAPNELVEVLENLRGRVLIEGINTDGRWSYFQYYY